MVSKKIQQPHKQVRNAINLQEQKFERNAAANKINKSTTNTLKPKKNTKYSPPFN